MMHPRGALGDEAAPPARPPRTFDRDRPADPRSRPLGGTPRAETRYPSGKDDNEQREA